MDAKKHWDSVYRSKAPTQVSWFQAEATRSLRMIREASPLSAAVLDVGGGASTLVDGLVTSGYHNVSVLDVSPTALEHARGRLGRLAEYVTWIEADILTAQFPAQSIDLWHDRAAFHFLTDASSRECYINQVKRIVRSHGLILLATFAEDGPLQCSGLPVRRYSVEQLQATLGPEFRLVTSEREDHVTPSGAKQSFVYCLCRYEPAHLHAAAG